MGAAESCCGAGLRLLLMPPEGSCTDDFTGFGEPEANSLLLIGDVRLSTHSKDKSQSFFSEGLAASIQAADQRLRVGAGPTALELTPRQEPAASTWPGQFYVWVQDLQATWAACRALGERLGSEVVESAVCVKDESLADALVLRDPGSGNAVVVNQAPKGYAQAIFRAQGFEDGPSSTSNLLCLMDLLCHVPPGAVAGIAAFYEQLLSARISRTSKGCRLHFAAGEAIRQTVTFSEDEDAASSWSSAAEKRRQLCIYLPSETAFRTAFLRCERAKLLHEAWEQAESAKEFSLEHCVDPASGSVVLPLGHVVRSPSHPECPLAKSTPDKEAPSMAGALAPGNPAMGA